MIIEILIANIYLLSAYYNHFLNICINCLTHNFSVCLFIFIFYWKLGSYCIDRFICNFFHLSETEFWIQEHEHDSCYTLPHVLPRAVPNKFTYPTSNVWEYHCTVFWELLPRWKSELVGENNIFCFDLCFLENDEFGHVFHIYWHMCVLENTSLMWIVFKWQCNSI